MNRKLMTLALLMSLPATATLADDDCRVPMQQWQSREALQQMAQSRGWRVGRIRIHDGCYQIRGTDANGQDFKAKIDPATLEVVKLRRRDADDDHRDDHGRDRGNNDDNDDHGLQRRRPAAYGADAAPAPGAPPANGLFSGSQPPAVTVK
ncbi:PepSY domain-containing protein [Paracoccus sp. (in: a-proteobacteria)]|uniref:PepSY domain-containing protein n=1 Tax=Paracoccus sp. TaxID=267 RepID=UPI00321FBB70